MCIMSLVSYRVLIVGTQKPTEGTGIKPPNYFRRNQMAQVTYRGVQYDTNRPKQIVNNKKELVYRGVPVNKEAVCK